MTKQEFLQIKIDETQDSLDSAIKYLLIVQQHPTVKSNYERFILMARGKLTRYQHGELNEDELFRLEIENSAQGIADERLFKLHNS